MFFSMRHWRRLLSASAAALAMAVPVSVSAAADSDYPNQPVRIIVGFAPGGTNDIVARTLAKKMQDRLDQPFVVENRPGAASAVAGAYVARAKPDGYNLLVTSSGGLTVNPVLMDNLGYDSNADYDPIALLGTFPLVVVTGADSEFDSLQALIEESKTREYGLNHGVATTSFQLVAEAMAEQSGAKFEHIGYRGSGPVIEALMKNEVDVAFLDSAAVMNHIEGGFLKALAVTTAERSPVLPEVPTIAEAGIDGYDAPIWTAFVAPAGLPEDVAKTLHDTLNDILAEEDMTYRLHQLGMTPGDADGQALRKRIADDIIRWQEVAQRADIPKN